MKVSALDVIQGTYCLGSCGCYGHILLPPPPSHGTYQAQPSLSREDCGLLNSIDPCKGNSVVPTTCGRQSSWSQSCEQCSHLISAGHVDPMVMLQDVVMWDPVLLVMWKTEGSWTLWWIRRSPGSCGPLRLGAKVRSSGVCRVSWTVVWLSLVKSRPDRFRRPLKLWSAPWLRSQPFHELLYPAAVGGTWAGGVSRAYSKKLIQRIGGRGGSQALSGQGRVQVEGGLLNVA